MGKIQSMLALDGESQFRRQLNLINANLKTLDKELQATSTQFAVGSAKMNQSSQVAYNYSKQMEFLTAKQDILKKAVANAEKEIESNSKRLAQSQKAYSDVSKSVQTVKNALETAKKVWGEDSQEVKNLENRLKDLEKEQSKAAKEVASAEKAVDRTAKAYHKYRQDLADTQTAINKVSDSQKNLNNISTEAKKSFDIVGTAVKTLDKNLDALPGRLGKVTDALKSVSSVGLKGIELGFQGVSKEFEYGLKGIETYVAALTGAGTAAIGFASKNGMSFEASMSKVQAYANLDSVANAAEIKALTEAAKETGATTTKTATEAANALGYLALNGWKTEQMLSALLPVTKASEAGDMDLASVANLTARSLTAYGKSADDAEDFLNILIAAQNNSSNSLSDLLTAYSDIAGTFAQLGVSMEESATILGVFANQGKSGAEASTALNSVMLRLLGTNKKSHEALEALGVTAWDDAGEFRGLTTVLRELGTALDALTTEEATQWEKDIGGVMRVQELQKLINGVMNEEQYNKVWDPINAAIGDQTLYKTAEVMMENLRGKVELLKSASSALGTSIYETFAEDATDGVLTLTHWVDMLNEGVKGGLPSTLFSIEEVANSISKSMTEGAEKAPTILRKNIRVFNKLATEGAKLLVQGFTENKDTIIPEIVRGFTGLSLNLIDLLPEFAEDVTDSGVTLFAGLAEGMQKMADRLVETGVLDEVVGTICQGISDNGAEIIAAGGDVLLTLARGIEQNSDELIGTGLTVIGKISDDIVDNFPQLLETAGKIITKLGDNLEEDETLEKLAESAVKIISSLAGFLAENAGGFAERTAEIVGRLGEELTTDENLDILFKAGEDFGDALLRGLWGGIQGGVKVGYHNVWKALFRMNGVDSEDAGTLADMAESIVEDVIGMAHSNQAKALYTGNGQEPERVGDVNINLSVDTVNGYSDVESLAGDVAQATDQAMRGKGRR